MCAAMRRSSRVLLVLAATTSALAPLPSHARRGPPLRAAAPLQASGGAAAPAEAPRRLLVMLSLGYGGSMFAFRPTLMIVLPALLKSLRLSEADGGALLSTCQLSYMVAKPVSQAASDGVDARLLLVASEVATGACFCLLALATTRLHLRVLFALIMAFQAPHVPAAARIITTRYAAAKRGKPFSTINAAANLASCAVPLVVTRAVARFGFRALFLAVGGFCALLPLVQYASIAEGDVAAPAAAAAPAPGLGGVLRSRVVWLLGLCYALLYFVRMGVEGWVGTFAPGCVGRFLFFWQVGGVVGSTAAGPLSDRRGGDPAPLGVAFAAALLAFALAFRVVGDETHPLVVAAVASLGGAAAYGARVLNVLTTRAEVDARSCGKADAVTNALAECGGAVAGLPLIALVQRAGWAAYPRTLAAAAAALVAAHVALAAECRRDAPSS